MTEDEYMQHDGLGLAGLLRAGEVTSAELMTTAISLAKRRDAQLNLLLNERFDESVGIAKAWESRGAFGGIPFLLKDSGIASARFPTTLGSNLFRGVGHARNAALVDRFEAAGLIPFARTAVPELCMSPTTEAMANGGPTRNPWDTERSAGGSSGGAAAAVATRVVPIAHGTDGGGSIRIPAACCGVYGLKPSRGLLPEGPLRGEGWGGLSSQGVLTRSVRDTAAVLDAVAGRDAGAPYAAPSQGQGFLAAVAHGTGRRLRIAAWRDAWVGITIESAPRAAVDQAVMLCRELGHEVVDTPLPADVDYAAFIEALIDVMVTNIVVSSDARLKALGRPMQADDLEPAMMDGYERGKRMSATRYVECIGLFHAIGRVLEGVMVEGNFDLVLTSALTRLPVSLGELSMRGPSFAAFRKDVAQYTPFLAIVNAAGLPAACLPLWWTEASVPVATQLIGRFGGEGLLLSISAELERLAPWAHRMPAAPGSTAPVSNQGHHA